MKTFLKVCAFILCFAVGTAAVGALTWSFLYVSVPTIADKTDELFKWNEYAEEENNNGDLTDEEQNPVEPEGPTDEEQTPVDPEVEATAFIFENEIAKITIG